MEERLKRLKAIDTAQKQQVLICLQQALWVSRVYARLRYEPDKELVRITWHSDRSETVVNVGLDNGAAMLYDIFRQRVCCRCGKIFRIPPTGRYPYIMVRHGHNLYFCGPTCKHKYEEAEEND